MYVWLGPASPDCWIPPVVEHGDNRDSIRVHAVEDTVGEPANDGAPNVLVYHLVHPGDRGDPVQHVPHGGREGCPQSPLLLIPIRCVVELGPRLGRQDYRQVHLRNLARARASTSSQGMTLLGLASRAA